MTQESCCVVPFYGILYYVKHGCTACVSLGTMILEDSVTLMMSHIQGDKTVSLLFFYAVFENMFGGE